MLSTPLKPAVAEDGQAVADVLGVHAVAQRTVADGDPGLFAAHRRGQRRADVFHVDVRDLCSNRAANATGSWPAMNVLPVSRFIRK